MYDLEKNIGFDKKENECAMLRRQDTVDEGRNSLTDYGFPS